MESVAVALSCLGLVVACLSWWEGRRSRLAAQQSAMAAHQSAEAAEEMARLESERRHDELAPQICLEWAELGRRGSVWTSGVRVINNGLTYYEEASAELMHAQAGAPQAATRIESLTTSYVGEVGDAIALGPLPAGEDAPLVIHPTYEEDGMPRGGPVRLRLTFKSPNGRRWIQHYDTSIPRPPRVYFA